VPSLRREMDYVYGQSFKMTVFNSDFRTALSVTAI